MFLHKVFASFLVVITAVCPWFRVGADTLPPRVVINELLWMGSPSSSSDEWIELRNLEDVPVDISGWTLTRRSSGADVVMLTIPSGKIIEAGGYFLISNFSETSASSELDVAPDLVDAAVSLVNSALQVRLLTAANLVVDTADDGTGTPLSGFFSSGTMYASMARNGLAADGVIADSWHVSSDSQHLRAGSLVRGTPRLPNENVAPVVPLQVDATARVGDAVQFDATDALDPDGDTLASTWDFGDGNSATGLAVTHTYATDGVFTVTLRVSDQAATTTATSKVTVTSQLDAPTGSATYSQVVISEIQPNPAGADDHEFIELATFDQPVDLGGWSLRDASGTTYVFPVGAILQSGSYLAFDRSRTKIALNNDEDQVSLIRPDDAVEDKVAYSGASEGLSYVRDAGLWVWTTVVTPNAENVIERYNHAPEAKFSVTPTASQRRVGTEITFDASDSIDEDGDALRMSWDFGDGVTAVGSHVKHTFSVAGPVVVRLTLRDARGVTDADEHAFTIKPALKAAAAAKKKGTVKGAAVVTDIASTKSAASSTDVVINGWVSALPGALGSGMLYLTDGQLGIGVKINAGLPKLSLGDALTVRGQKRTSAGEAYILVNSADGIVLGAPAEQKIPEPKVVSAEMIDQSFHGLLVQVEGEVTALSGSRFSLDDGSAEIAAYVKSTTGFKRPAMHSGDRVRVIGIVSSGASGLRILPRTKDDVLVTVQPRTSEPQNIVVAPPRATPLWGYGLVILAGLAGYILATRRKLVTTR